VNPTRVSAYGITVELPEGWDGVIYRRTGGDPTLHAGNFPLPPNDADFGSLAIAAMPASGVFVVLTQYALASAGQGLFAHRGLPAPVPERALRTRAFTRLQPGRLGAQAFCTASGRPFCLYVVVGRQPDPGSLLREANEVLSTVRIEPPVRPGT
jgi:hypothetical protein